MRVYYFPPLHDSDRSSPCLMLYYTKALNLKHNGCYGLLALFRLTSTKFQVRSPMVAICKLDSLAVEHRSHDPWAEGSTTHTLLLSVLFSSCTKSRCVGGKRAGTMCIRIECCARVNSQAGRAPVMSIPLQLHRSCLGMTYSRNRSMGYHINQLVNYIT